MLSPATVPPATDVADCNIPITETTDGNARPLGCPDSGVNAAAWTFYIPIAPHVMSLGPAVTSQQVLTAACADTAAGGGQATAPEASHAAQVAGTYYGWPASDWSNLDYEITVGGTCKAP